MKKVLLVILALSLALSCAIGFAACSDADDEGVITIRNLYFDDWDGNDAYTRALEEQFGIKFKVSSYSWADWADQVSHSYTTRTLPNVFNDDVDNYNFYGTYLTYVDDGSVKALPDDLSKWPHVKSLIEDIDDIEHFYVDDGSGARKLYGIPVAKNIKETEADFSTFTYVYRRDWAKELAEKGQLGFELPADDVYTWDQFNKLVKAFYDKKCKDSNGREISDMYAFADVEWGFPSVVNFYKDAPHCFTMRDNEVVNNYLTTEYIEGLEAAKSFITSRYNGYAQTESNDGDANKKYYGGRIGIFYENLSLANYATLRQNVKDNNLGISKQKLDDMTAILKVKGPDNKYALEGAEDWFSMTFFSSKISDAKMEKILDIMDYLLSEEGTLYGLYGAEGYDYERVELEGATRDEYDYVWEGKDETYGIKLGRGWKKDEEERYVNPYNGARYLRYICTLGYDIVDKDPLTDMDAYKILNKWTKDMKDAQAAGNLRVLKEPANVKWLTSERKTAEAVALLDGAKTIRENYLYGEITLDEYKAQLKSETWGDVLDEINIALGLR